MGLLKDYIQNKLLLIVFLSYFIGCSNSMNCDCNKRPVLRDNSVKALALFNAPDSLIIWDNFDTSKTCAETCKKPQLILFTSVCCHSQTPPKEFLLLQNKKVVDLINSNYIFVCLFTDDVTIDTTKNISSENQSKQISYGERNAILELNLTQENGPPKFVVLKNNKVCDIFSDEINNLDYNLFINFIARNID